MFTVPASAKANERRGHQEVGTDILMHAGFKVAIARENASGNEIVLGDGFFQSGMKRAGIADTLSCSRSRRVGSLWSIFRPRRPVSFVVGRILPDGRHLWPVEASAHLAHLCRRRPHGQVLEPIVMRVAFSGFS